MRSLDTKFGKQHVIEGIQWAAGRSERQAMRYQYSIRDVLAFAGELGVLHANDVEGCATWEIEQLQNHLGIVLPQRYVEFLSIMGKRAGGFVVGSRFLFEEVPEVQAQFRNFIESRELSAWMADDAFAVLGHQGYVFDFFLLSHGDDPPVFSVGDGIQDVVLFSWSFSSYLNLLVQGQADIRETRASFRAAHQKS